MSSVPDHGSFTICCIDPQHLGRLWPHCGHLFLRGTIEVCKNKGTTKDEVLQAAMVELLDHVLRAHKKMTQFWVVIDDQKHRVIAAMTTELLVDEELGGKVLWVNRMSGERILWWGHAICRRMISFMQEEGCSRVLFAGRPALKRAYKDVRAIKDIGDGHWLYEGVLA